VIPALTATWPIETFAFYPFLNTLSWWSPVPSPGFLNSDRQTSRMVPYCHYYIRLSRRAQLLIKHFIFLSQCLYSLLIRVFPGGQALGWDSCANNCLISAVELIHTWNAFGANRNANFLSYVRERSFTFISVCGLINNSWIKLKNQLTSSFPPLKEVHYSGYN
jgi:hypothetical protein